MKNDFAGLIRKQNVIKDDVAEVPQEKQSNKKITSIPVSTKKPKQLGKNKRSDYKLVSFYLKKDTHLAFKKIILERAEDMSDIVEKLVSDWVKKH